MAKLRDKLWLWGQSPDVHYEKDNPYNLPGHSRMTAMEGAVYFDIPNVCRVRMMGHPMPPYDQESLALDTCKEVVWSLLGASCEPTTPWGDLDEVCRQAKMFSNISGGVFDDFFLPERIAEFTPEKLREVKRRLCEKSGRPLDMWVVCYEDKLYEVENIAAWFDTFDVITFWMWNGCNLDKARSNLMRIRELAPKKRVMAGCYLWNYGESCPLTAEQMESQVALYYELLKRGEVDGIVVCSNCIADLGIEAVTWMRNWIREHGDEEI
ncbi:MAG: hypothetical protein J6K62_00660 [Clostridia bacterium]|nr:hypothetical protein [Clostridia bacterium]